MCERDIPSLSLPTAAHRLTQFNATRFIRFALWSMGLSVTPRCHLANARRSHHRPESMEVGRGYGWINARGSKYRVGVYEKRKSGRIVTYLNSGEKRLCDRTATGDCAFLYVWPTDCSPTSAFQRSVTVHVPSTYATPQYFSTFISVFSAVCRILLCVCHQSTIMHQRSPHRAGTGAPRPCCMPCLASASAVPHSSQRVDRPRLQ